MSEIFGGGIGAGGAGALTGAWVGGGNSFGQDQSIGSNDAFAVLFETGGVTRFTIAGGSATLTGPSGGSTFVGGTAAGNDLTLRATSDVAGGAVHFQSAPGTSTGSFTSSGIFNVGSVSAASSTELARVRKDQNSDTWLLIENRTDGTAATAFIGLAAGGQYGAGSVPSVALVVYSPLFTTSGLNIADSAQLATSTLATGGLVISTSAAAPLIFGTTATEEMRLLPGGGLMINATVKVGTEELRVGGASQFDGALNIADAVNLVVGATTGTRIGTATTQKIGFYNAIPVVQGASVADATGGATIDAEARAAINTLISRIEATGLIATI